MSCYDTSFFLKYKYYFTTVNKIWNKYANKEAIWDSLLQQLITKNSFYFPNFKLNDNSINVSKKLAYITAYQKIKIVEAIAKYPCPKEDYSFLSTGLRIYGDLKPGEFAIIECIQEDKSPIFHFEIKDFGSEERISEVVFTLDQLIDTKNEWQNQGYKEAKILLNK